MPINPVGNAKPEVFSRIALSEELSIPNFGLETMHHVHADDEAEMVLRAFLNCQMVAGEAFNAVWAQALNLKSFTEAMVRWLGHEPRLRFQPLEDWTTDHSAEDAQQSWEHIVRSSCHSVEKARRRLGHEPRYASLAAVQEAALALIAAGRIKTPQSWAGWLKSDQGT